MSIRISTKLGTVSIIGVKGDHSSHAKMDLKLLHTEMEEEMVDGHLRKVC